MEVAVSIMLTKKDSNGDTGCRHLLELYNAISIEEAVGKAVLKTLTEDNKFFAIASCRAIQTGAVLNE